MNEIIHVSWVSINVMPPPSAIGNPFEQLDSLFKAKTNDASPQQKENSDEQGAPDKPEAAG